MDVEQMKKDPEPWEFRSKPAWQRIIIMLGGVTVNIILGFVIYMIIMFVWGKNVLPSESLPMGLNPSPIIQELGFEKGDQIISINGQAIDSLFSMRRALAGKMKGESVEVVFKRGSKTTSTTRDSCKAQVFVSQASSFPIFHVSIGFS